MIKTTLRNILDQNPCSDGWNKLLFKKGLADKNISDELSTCPERELELDKEFPLSDILSTNGLQDAIWAISNVAACNSDEMRLFRKFAVWCARKSEHLMDERSKYALDVSWRYANGIATKKELRKASSEANDAIADAAAVYAAASAAASAADADIIVAVAAREKHAGKLKQILDAGEWVDD